MEAASYQGETAVKINDKVRVWTRGNVYVGVVEGVEYTTTRVDGGTREVYLYELELYCLGIGHVQWSQQMHGGRFEIVTPYAEGYEKWSATRGEEA